MRCPQERVITWKSDVARPNVRRLSCLYRGGWPVRRVARPLSWPPSIGERRMRVIRALLLLVLLPAVAVAQGTGSSLWLKDSFKSAKLGADRTIYVATPTNYGTSAQRYPVLVLLDADDEP